MSVGKTLTAGAVALATMWAPVQAAPAGGAFGSRAAHAADAASVVQARYRGHRHYRHRHGGRNLALGIGVGLLGAIIASEAYRPRPGYYYDDEAYDGPYYAPSGHAGDPRALCAQSFRSFEWDTGLYTTYGGERRLCPYLR